MAWLGVGGGVEALRALAARVEEAVRAAGLPPHGGAGEGRPFNAHLTLARVDRRATAAQRGAIAAAAHALAAPPPAPFVARAVVLVRSHLDGPVPRYEVLSRHP